MVPPGRDPRPDPRGIDRERSERRDMGDRDIDSVGRERERDRSERDKDSAVRERDREHESVPKDDDKDRERARSHYRHKDRYRCIFWKFNCIKKVSSYYYYLKILIIKMNLKI